MYLFVFINHCNTVRSHFMKQISRSGNYYTGRSDSRSILKTVLRLFIFLVLFSSISIVSSDSSSMQFNASPNADTSLTDTLPEDTIQKIRIMCVGDIMTHMPLVNAARLPEGQGYDFSSSFELVKPLLKEADIVIGNLETVLAGDAYGISGYPAFNSPQVLAFNLKDAGFNVLTTANNHSFDKSSKGLKNTLHLLDSAGILHTGTFSDTAEDERCLILNIKSIRLGLLSYTYGTNGELSKKVKKLINIIDTNAILQDIEYLKRNETDAIMASIHFGTEYRLFPDNTQKSIVQFLWRNGVLAVFGHHSHTLQPSVFDTSNNRFAVFSLGNFLSNQRGKNREFGGIADITLKKECTNQIYIESAVIHPTCTYLWRDSTRVRYSIIPLNELFLKKKFDGYPDKLIKVADTLSFLNRHFHSLDGKFRYVEPQAVTSSDSSR